MLCLIQMIINILIFNLYYLCIYYIIHINPDYLYNNNDQYMITNATSNVIVHNVPMFVYEQCFLYTD